MKYNNPKVIEKTKLSVIHNSINEYFNVENDYIFTKTRVPSIVKLRQWFHYFSVLLNDRYSVSYAYIGAYYSEKTGYKFDHATIMHSYKKINEYLDVYPEDVEVKNQLLNLITKK